MITVDTIFVYLCQQESWISDVQIAAALDSSMPITRKLLTELGDVVENDGDGNWRIVKTTQVEIVSESSNELTIEEENDLLRLERRVERGFYMAGVALKQIRDRRLYRQEYKTFEEYCRDRLDFSRRNADYLIISVEVIENLLTSASPKMRSNASQKYQFLPTSTRQALPLSKLPPSKQVLAWEKALLKSNNGKPSGRLVREVVQGMQHQEQIDNYPDDKREDLESKPSANKRSVGLNYKPGLGNEWYVKVEESTYQQLKNYQQLNGLATLNGAIANLLALALGKQS